MIPELLREQAQAQFDWLQERLRDPNFVGIALSGSGEFFSVAALRSIKSSEELQRLLQPDSYPIYPVDKSVDNSLGKSSEKA